MEKKLNILMVSDSFFPIVGGREYVINALMKEYSALATPILLTGEFKGKKGPIKDESQPYKIIRTKGIRLTKNEYLNRVDKNTKKIIEEYITTHKVDIIHTETKFALASYALSLGKKFNIPVVTTAHTDYKSQYKKHGKQP